MDLPELTEEIVVSSGKFRRAGRVMNLDEIIAGLRAAGAEFEDVEAKRAAGGVPESLASTMAAFANARGGPRQ